MLGCRIWALHSWRQLLCRGVGCLEFRGVNSIFTHNNFLSFFGKIMLKTNLNFRTCYLNELYQWTLLGRWTNVAVKPLQRADLRQLKVSAVPVWLLLFYFKSNKYSGLFISFLCFIFCLNWWLAHISYCWNSVVFWNMHYHLICVQFAPNKTVRKI